MSPDEWRALLEAWQEQTPAVRDSLLGAERGFRRLLGAWRQQLEQQFPPGTRIGIIPPPASGAPPTRVYAFQQDEYNARVTADHAPTQDEDFTWAASKGLSQRRVLALRRNNPDRRLHSRGPRSRR